MAGEKPLTVYLIAGEPSGDLIGAHLMQALKHRVPNIRFHGVGGERMEKEGLKSLFPYHDLALLGFIEILPHILTLFARINLTAEDILAKQPDVVVSIDVPGFSFRVAEKLRNQQTTAKLVHYVAPTVWVYNPDRALVWAKLFDHLLTLLPFEPPYFTKAGLATTFVGHPVVTETTTGDGQAFRQKYRIAPETKLFCLLPGSRKTEIKRHLPIFARAVTLLSNHFPDLAIAVAVPKHMLPYVAPYFQRCPFRAVVTANDDDKKNALAAADMTIAKSGTVTLEVAQAGNPMVVAYRVNPLSAWMLKRKCLVKYVTLINILENQEVVPELLQERCAPEFIASTSLQLMTHPEPWQHQKTLIESALKKLRPENGELPSNLAAETILRLLKR